MPIHKHSFLVFAFGITFFVIFAVGFCPRALAVIDQEYLPIPDLIGSVGSQTELAQSFTVGVTGQLTGFDIAVQRNPNAEVIQPLLYDIRRTVGGVPEDDAGILVSGSVSAQNISDVGPVSPQLLPSLTHIDVAGASLQVTAGDVLAIVLRSNDPGQIGNGFAYEWYGLSSFAWFHPASGPYDRGSAFYPPNGYWVPDQTTDLASRTEVTLAGDYNEDGHVNAGDITALELALTNLSLYKSTYGVSDSDLIQINQLPGESTTNLNNSDLQALLNYLKSGVSADSVPEPSTLVLLALGGVIAFAAKRHTRKDPLADARLYENPPQAAGLNGQSATNGRGFILPLTLTLSRKGRGSSLAETRGSSTRRGRRAKHRGAFPRCNHRGLNGRRTRLGTGLNGRIKTRTGNISLDYRGSRGVRL